MITNSNKTTIYRFTEKEVTIIIADSLRRLGFPIADTASISLSFMLNRDRDVIESITLVAQEEFKKLENSDDN